MRTTSWVCALLLSTVSCKEQATTTPREQKPADTSIFAEEAPPPQARSFGLSSAEAAPNSDKSSLPLGLTASDGTGLTLVALDARAVVRDPIAFTELHLTFENPEPRVLEGQFRITLPANAKLSRFAMNVNGRMQEGEVVEKQRARRAYEDFLHRKQDPALLEQAAGNEFSARVFPIPARGQKELIISYSQELASSKEPYRLSLRGLPTIGKLDVDVHNDFSDPFSLHRTHFVPDADIQVPVGDGKRQGRKDGNLLVVRVPLRASALAAATPPVDEIESLAILVDSSASRALGWEAQVRTIHELIDGLRSGAAAQAPLMVAAFDQDVAILFEGTPASYDDAAKKKLAERRPLGASNLHAALGTVQKHPTRFSRVLLVSDGIPTAGPTDGARLAGAAKELGAKGVQRIDSIAVGGLRDDSTLERIVAAGARAGVVVDGNGSPAAIADRLVRPTLGDTAVVLDGAEWSWPKTTRGRQLGDELLLFARLPQSAADKPLAVRIGSGTYTLPAAAFGPAPRPLLERALAGAEIQDLVEQREGLLPAAKEERTKLDDRIVSLSVGHRVLSPSTALLVLETEADYARFKLDRNALADILRVEGGEIAVTSRTMLPKNGATTGGKNKAETEAADEGTARERSATLPSPEPVPPTLGNAAPPPPGAQAAPAAKDKEADLEPPGDRLAAEEPAKSARGFGGASAPAPVTAEPEQRRAAPSPRLGAAPSSGALHQLHDSLDGGDARPRKNPYTGKLAVIMAHLANKRVTQGLDAAWSWHAESPGDVLALVALGEALEKNDDPKNAARAYGSLIDFFPARADIRRFAGERLDRVAMNDPAALALAADSYAKAVEQRPDHPASHRLLAFALVKQNKLEAAFAALEAGLKQKYPEDRFAGVRRILAEDLGLIGAAWAAEEPAKATEIDKRLVAAGGIRERGASLRFVLNWETDANDVDFHIHDAKGGHAYYGNQTLGSGGSLYADVTTGYGPECFTIRGGAYAAPYRLEAHYYSRGPMGYGMGKLEIVRHDGKGKLTFEERPFVVMQDEAFVQLGTVR